MSRLSGYLAAHGAGHESAAYLSQDPLYDSPRYRRSDRENVPFNTRLPRNQSDNFLSEPRDARLSEWMTRGYNSASFWNSLLSVLLSILGKVMKETNHILTAVASSDPGRDDYGFACEDMSRARYTPMGDAHKTYKDSQEMSDAQTALYKKRKKAIGDRLPRKQQREPYFGNPSMTRGHHREMYGITSSVCAADYSQIDQRANFDRDYLCHYKNQEMRKGHLDKIENERNRLGDIEMKRNNHSPWI